MMESTTINKGELQLKQVNNDIIRIGFMMMLEKL
jgi:hypothetical protein